MHQIWISRHELEGRALNLVLYGVWQGQDTKVNSARGDFFMGYGRRCEKSILSFTRNSFDTLIQNLAAQFREVWFEIWYGKQQGHG